MNVSISGATFVRADPTIVWAALYDVEVISRCIPGCQSLVRVSDRAFHLVLQVRLGPVRLAFQGTVEVSESDPPRCCRLIGRGVGHKAGEATGTATITLVEQSGGCKLLYEVQAETLGPLSVASPRILSGVGKAIATFFAGRFGVLVGGESAKRPRTVLQRA